ncbi:MAG TPA: hypothetical protein VFM25_10375 [Verrucomicrobiae bacterium]|nr:hypothetical protein [Verrucomicrobiae bacterium]
MKKIIYVALAAVFGCLVLTAALPAPDKPAKYEYAVVKWDGPDRLFYNLPDKFELVHLRKIGIEIPKEAQEEEFCLATAANIMAKDGWNR